MIRHVIVIMKVQADFRQKWSRAPFTLSAEMKNKDRKNKGDLRADFFQSK